MESTFSTESLPFVEGLYEQFLKDEKSVPPAWRDYFASLGSTGHFTDRPRLGPSFKPSSVFGGSVPTNGAAAKGAHAATHGAAPKTNGALAASGVSEAAVRQDQVDALVRAYRVRGHMMAKDRPLGLPARPSRAGPRILRAHLTGSRSQFSSAPSSVPRR